MKDEGKTLRHELRMRKTGMMQRTFMIALVCCAILAGTSLADKKKSAVPAGIDSTTKLQADSLGRALFGEKRNEDEARRQLDDGKEDFRAGDKFLLEADSLRRTGVDTTLKKPGGLIGLFRQNFGDTALTSNELETRKRGEAALRRAAGEFDHALKISPDLSEARMWLAATYDRLKDWEKSAATYREILNERQGEDRLWFNYGYATLQAGSYEQAIRAFEQAIHIAVLVNGDSTKIPVNYLIYAGEAFTRTYQERLALERFRTAQSLADTTVAAQIQKTIDWIEWDDGGIATSEYRDAAFRAENLQKWDDAREAYLGGLKTARTDQARSELTYRLALLEYQHGSRTDGLARMKDLIEKMQFSPVEYRESYGRMLFAYAQTVEKEGNVRGALGYFLQSTKFEWSGQGAGYLEIARIASNDLDTAIEQAAKSLTYPLTPDQQMAAYRILESSYRAKGDWDNMKKYRQLMESKP
jgi:tetratricopeptide (TPR) repeat protein